MATLHFGTGTDLKVFTPVSSALNGLPNGSGTMIVLIKKITAGTAQDFSGLTDNGGPGAWYHCLWQDTSDKLNDDDGLAIIAATAAATDDNTNWWWYAVDWQATGSTTERFHWRNHTSGGSWTNSDSTGNRGANRSTTGTIWFRIGAFGDGGGGNMDIALVAVWAGTRFTDSDYGTWTKTSDLYNHALGKPTMLIECNASTLTDIGLNPSTYSSANSTGTTLTGGDPPTWTFDGVGSANVNTPIFQAIPLMGGH